MVAPPAAGAVATVGSLGCTVAGASVVFVPLDPTGAGVVFATVVLVAAPVVVGTLLLDEPLSLLHPAARNRALAMKILANFCMMSSQPVTVMIPTMPFRLVPWMEQKNGYTPGFVNT